MGEEFRRLVLVSKSPLSTCEGVLSHGFRNRLKCHLFQSNRYGFRKRLMCNLLQAIMLSLSLIVVNVVGSVLRKKIQKNKNKTLRANLSSLNLVSIFRCPSPPHNPLSPRRVVVNPV